MRTLHRLLTAAAIGLGLTLTLAQVDPAAAGETLVYQSEYDFDDVMDALKLGIEERGLYINNVMNMGESLHPQG